MTRAALERLADEMVASLAGKYHDGSPNTGLIHAMGQDTAHRKILDALLAQEAGGDGVTLCRQLRIGSEHAEQLRKLHRAAELLCEALSLPESEASSLAVHWFDQRGIAFIGGIVPNKTITRAKAAGCGVWSVTVGGQTLYATRPEDAEIFAAKHDGTVVGPAGDGVKADGGAVVAWADIASRLGAWRDEHHDCDCRAGESCGCRELKEIIQEIEFGPSETHYDEQGAQQDFVAALKKYARASIAFDNDSNEGNAVALNDSMEALLALWKEDSPRALKAPRPSEPTPDVGAEPVAWREADDLALIWDGQARALRMLDEKRAASNLTTIAEAETLETCAKQLRSISASPPSPPAVVPDARGPFCRDCADENGTCPHSGLPCDPSPQNKAVVPEREAIAWLIFDSAVGKQHRGNSFYSEEIAGCFDTADAILALYPAPTFRDGIEAAAKIAVSFMTNEIGVASFPKGTIYAKAASDIAAAIRALDPPVTAGSERDDG